MDLGSIALKSSNLKSFTITLEFVKLIYNYKYMAREKSN